MTVKLTTHSSFYDFSAAMNQRKAFRTSGALRGGPEEGAQYLSGWQLGQLDPKWHASVRKSVYVVWSYGTPIAWMTEAGDWTMPYGPDAKYSVTTSRHQSKIATAIGVLS